MNTQMTAAVVADTHTLHWMLFKSARLSAAAGAALSAAQTAAAPIYVSAISVVELCYLAEEGKVRDWVYRGCLRALDDPATVLTICPLDRVIAGNATQIPRALVPDMPDRIIAATALTLGLPLISRDTNILKLTNITIVW